MAIITTQLDYQISCEREFYVRVYLMYKSTCCISPVMDYEPTQVKIFTVLSEMVASRLHNTNLHVPGTFTDDLLTMI